MSTLNVVKKDNGQIIVQYGDGLKSEAKPSAGAFRITKTNNLVTIHLDGTQAFTEFIGDVTIQRGNEAPVQLTHENWETLTDGLNIQNCCCGTAAGGGLQPSPDDDIAYVQMNGKWHKPDEIIFQKKNEIILFENREIRSGESITFSADQIAGIMPGMTIELYGSEYGYTYKGVLQPVSSPVNDYSTNLFDESGNWTDNHFYINYDNNQAYFEAGHLMDQRCLRAYFDYNNLQSFVQYKDFNNTPNISNPHFLCATGILDNKQVGSWSLEKLRLSLGIPNEVFLTQAEYDNLKNNGKLAEDTYYNVY